MDGDGDRAIDGVEHRADLLLHEIAQAFAAARPRFDGADDAVGRGDADVRGNQQFFERVDRIDIDRPRAPLRLIRAADDFLEPVDDLLLGAGETLADAPEDAHQLILQRSPQGHQGLRVSVVCRAINAKRDATRLRDAAGAASTPRRRCAHRSPVEHRRHLRRDRQLDAVARAKRERGRRRLHAFGDHFHARENLAEMPAARELDADVTVAAQSNRYRSAPDRPGRSGPTVSRASAGRAGQPRDLRQPARDERRERVVSQPESFDDAGGDRDDVLERADRARRRPHPRSRRGGSTDSGILPAPSRWRAASLEAARTAVGNCCATSTAKLGPDSTTIGATGAQLLRDHFRHSQQRVRLRALSWR